MRGNKKSVLQQNASSGGRPALERGVGLIEVLMALIVLSIGFLVSANMQLRGMRSNQETYNQSQAMMLANEIMDRMRNNRSRRCGSRRKRFDFYRSYPFLQFESDYK